MAGREIPAQLTVPVCDSPGTREVLDSTVGVEGLEAIAHQFSRFVFKVAYGVLRNSHDAEDVVQEVFLRVHRSGVKDVIDVKAWLATMAFRIAVDRLRRPRSDALETEPFSGSPSAEQIAIHRERVTQVQRLITALPAELRYPLVLSAMEELSSSQVGVILGISEAAVRGRIFRARQILRERLAAITGKSS